MPAAEKSHQHSHAEKSNRADGECFLNAIAIKMGLGSGRFGGGIAAGSQDEQKNSSRFIRWPRNNEEQSDRRAHTDQREQKQDQTQKDVGGTQVGYGFLLEALVLRLGDVALLSPVRQEFASAESFFAGCRVESHADLPKRRAI